MTTYYVNDHNSGNRVLYQGKWCIRYTTGNGDDTQASPCDYGREIYFDESMITGKTTQGICNMGGRAWKIDTTYMLVEGDPAVVGVVDVSKEPSAT